VKDFRKLQVWQKAHQLTLNVYRVSRDFPSDERFGLTSQIRRSSSSVPTNIAEGCGRSTDGDLARFCDIAAGSASEAEYQVLLAHDIEYINRKAYDELTNDVWEVKRMLVSYVQYLRPNA